MRLRGAAARGDLRRVGRTAVAALLLTFAVASVLTFFGAVHRSHQVAKLRTQGVPVTVQVTSCIGHLGGSGSNIVSYTCRGSFELNGHNYSEGIPGSRFLGTGTTIQLVTLPSDPGTLATPLEAAKGASGTIYVLPGAFLAALIVGALLAVQGGLYRRGAPGGV